MSHSHHCHCGLHDQLKKFKAGKLGLLGSVLIIGHLLFHAAECLVLPAIFIALHGHEAEAVDELTESEVKETTYSDGFRYLRSTHQSLMNYLDTQNLFSEDDALPFVLQ